MITFILITYFTWLICTLSSIFTKKLEILEFISYLLFLSCVLSITGLDLYMLIPVIYLICLGVYTLNKYSLD